MGSRFQIYDVIGPGEVVELSQLAKGHQENNGSRYRIAVHVSGWKIDDTRIPITMRKDKKEVERNRLIVCEICMLISLNIQLVFVFDGPQDEKFGYVDPWFTAARLQFLKTFLMVAKLPSVTATSMAVMECAALQRLGVVQAVLSEDPVILGFGSECLLRRHRPNNRMAPGTSTGIDWSSNEYAETIFVEVYRECNLSATFNLGRANVALYILLVDKVFNTKLLNIYGAHKRAIGAVDSNLGDLVWSCGSQVELKACLDKFKQKRTGYRHLSTDLIYEDVIKFKSPHTPSEVEVEGITSTLSWSSVPFWNEYSVRSFTMRQIGFDLSDLSKYLNSVTFTNDPISHEQEVSRPISVPRPGALLTRCDLLRLDAQIRRQEERATPPPLYIRSNNELPNRSFKPSYRGLDDVPSSAKEAKASLDGNIVLSKQPNEQIHRPVSRESLLRRKISEIVPDSGSHHQQSTPIKVEDTGSTDVWPSSSKNKGNKRSVSNDEAISGVSLTQTRRRRYHP